MLPIKSRAATWNMSLKILFTQWYYYTCCTHNLAILVFSSTYSQSSSSSRARASTTVRFIFRRYRSFISFPLTYELRYILRFSSLSVSLCHSMSDHHRIAPKVGILYTYKCMIMPTYVHWKTVAGWLTDWLAGQGRTGRSDDGIYRLRPMRMISVDFVHFHYKFAPYVTILLTAMNSFIHLTTLPNQPYQYHPLPYHHYHPHFRTNPLPLHPLNRP